jgi:hypothetical protein
MGRQLALKDHCLLCLKDLNMGDRRTELGTSRWKNLYEREDPGFSAVVKLCVQCLQYLRGGNWPSDVYAKLTLDRRGEGERAVEALVPA